MRPFTQKYTIVSFIDHQPDGHEFLMEDWPPHMTLADVFAIEGAPENLMKDLEAAVAPFLALEVKAIGEEWFGEDHSIGVQLFERTPALEQLHSAILGTLKLYGVIFNNPEYAGEGFKPHMALSPEAATRVMIDSVSFIDMFPGNDPRQRRVLGTVTLGRN